MTGEYIFSSALKEWLEPPDFEECKEELPIEGVCPWCNEDLDVNDVTEIVFCKTPECKYSELETEKKNRRRWEVEHGI